MKTIWTFGDSFTYGDGCRPDKGIRDRNIEYYKKFYKEEYDIWPNLLGKLIDCDVMNMAKSGASNDIIIDSIIDSFNMIDADDIVIIQKSWSQRFDIPMLSKNEFRTHYGEELSMLATDLRNTKYGEHRKEMETILNYGVFFASHPLYRERQNKRFEFLNSQLLTKANKVIIWDIDNNTLKDSINNISEHSKNEFNDYHFSFVGHAQFANMLYTTHLKN